MRPSARRRVPASGCRSPAMTRSSVDLPAPLGPVSAIRSGPRIVRSAVVGEQLPPTTADLKAVAPQHGAPGGHVGVGQVEHDGIVVAKRASRPRRVVPARRSTRSALYVVDTGLPTPARRASARPRRSSAARHSSGCAPRCVDRRAARSRACCRLPLLALELLLGVADIALRHLLGVAARACSYMREIAAVEQHFAAIQLGDAVHPVEQHAVVADQQQASGKSSSAS